MTSHVFCGLIFSLCAKMTRATITTRSGRSVRQFSKRLPSTSCSRVISAVPCCFVSEGDALESSTLPVIKISSWGRVHDARTNRYREVIDHSYVYKWKQALQSMLPLRHGHLPVFGDIPLFYTFLRLVFLLISVPSSGSRKSGRSNRLQWEKVYRSNPKRSSGNVLRDG